MPLTPEIAAVIRSNPGERLLVPPSQWTIRHLELLNIQFEHLDQAAHARDDSANANHFLSGNADRSDDPNPKSAVLDGRRAKRFRTWHDLHVHLVCESFDSSSSFVVA
jgi:hypothetical protein